MSDVAILITGLAKTFTLHGRGGAEIPVFAGLDLEVRAGECVALAGPSGAGKSTLMRAIYGTYRPTAGEIAIAHDGALCDIAAAPAGVLRAIRRCTLGYVSQFLRVIPRVDTLQLVMEPLLENGVSVAEARERAERMLDQVNLPRSHWGLPPATFSGGEQQRVNLARSLVRAYPILLLDEPTASLDAKNRDVVIHLMRSALDAGAALVGIFHDPEMRARLGARGFEVADFRPTSA